MKSKCITVILCAIIMIPVLAYARIGETREEIEKRYGPLTKEEDVELLKAKTLYFDFHGYAVKVAIVANKSQSESYEKKDQTDFTEDEWMEFCRKMPLAKLGNLGNQRKVKGHYRLSDDSMYAFCTTKGVSIMAKGFYEKLQDEIAKVFSSKKDSTDGF